MSEEQFKQEAERLRPVLFKIAGAYLEEKEDCDDAVQDLFAKLWTMADGLQMPIDNLAKVVLRNICITLLREKKKQNATAKEYALDAKNSNSSDDISETLLRLINILPAKQQIAIRLRHIDGMETKQIAQLTGSNEAAVRQQLCRARQALRTLFLKEQNND